LRGGRIGSENKKWAASSRVPKAGLRTQNDGRGNSIRHKGPDQGGRKRRHTGGRREKGVDSIQSQANASWRCVRS